jgi:hypothetical protein
MKPIRNNSKQKGLALLRETEVAIGLFKAGLGYLQKINATNDFYYLPLFLLSQGLERLMKVIICMEINERTGNYPNSQFECFKGKKGHDLNALLNLIKERCFTQEHVSSRPALEDDNHLICDNVSIKKILDILSHYNTEGRYYYLNVVLDMETYSSGPELDWQELEDNITLADMPDRKIEDSTQLDNFYVDIKQHIIPLLESLVRALGRLFTLGNLGEMGNTLFTRVSDFVCLMDRDLGKKDYT